MKALGLSALLIALLSVANPLWADFVYFGTLAGDQPYTINIDNAQNGQGKTIVTVQYLIGGKPATATREARLSKPKFDVIPVAAGARLTVDQEIPKGTRFIVIDVAPPMNGTVILDVRQAATLFSDTFVGGGSYHLDVE